MFDGAASRTYVEHLVQDWNEQPFASAAYLSDYSPTWVPLALGEPISDRVHLAGDGYTREANWSEVHVAARSARAAVDEMFG